MMNTNFDSYWNWGQPVQQQPIAGPDFSGMASWGAGATAAPEAAGPSIWDSFFSKTQNGLTTQGWGGPALGAASGLFNGWLGWKQLGIAKDSLAESKRQFGLNYDAQRRTTNSALEDRQAARVASNPGAYQSVGDYMARYSIPGG